MLVWLAEHLVKYYSGFNVFSYLTFRAIVSLLADLAANISSVKQKQLFKLLAVDGIFFANMIFTEILADVFLLIHSFALSRRFVFFFLWRHCLRLSAGIVLNRKSLGQRIQVVQKRTGNGLAVPVSVQDNAQRHTAIQLIF